eukprot:Tamp_11701.p1 GENE.Tamp_11701~~Tamp_11701.p1  ORF type:complete len:459 (-),score=100.27 Tamp_11701:513-1718(-)
MFSDDSLRLKRQRMVAELKGLRGVEGGMRQQLARLNQQEHALENAWQTTEVAADGRRRGRHAQETREALSSSIFTPAFPGAQAGLSVCEPWPSCCPGGNADNCYGVVSGGVLGAHACSPYPMCCGVDTHNCFDETSMQMTPDDSAAAPSEVDITHLAAVCEGEEQLKQCLTQTQSCMSPSSEGISADTCTCFSSSLYCSYPQTPESCSPCPMACQQKIYEWFKSTQTEMDGTEMQCPLFEKAQANEDIAALDDGSFRPYAWFSDKELHPAPPPPKVVAAAKEPLKTPPINIKWPRLEGYKYPYKPAPDPYYPKYYRWYDAPGPTYAYTPPSYTKPRYGRRPHADRPKYYPPHQPTWSNYVNPKVAEREYVEAPYSYSFPHKSSIPPHMIDGYDMNKHVLDA